MTTTIQQLKWATLTAAINEMKSPNQFLRRMLFSNHITVPTEDIEIGLFTKAREMAPFVRKNGEAIMVGGHGETYQTVSPPNIRIKRPFTPSDLLFNRRPGTVIFSTGLDMQMSAADAHVARDMQVMADMITNAEEWLAAMALRGTISYSNSEQEVFTVTFPKPSTNNITLSTFWNDGTPANVRLEENFHTAKQVLSDEVGLQPTDCILGSEAATHFRTLITTGNVKTLDIRNVGVGMADFTTQFSEDGAIYLGTFSGIRVWEYSRTVSVDGVSTPMVRAKYAEFVSTSPGSERVLYYGAIADMEAMQGRLAQAERFSKSWIEKDPSALIALSTSRPLPTPRRPGASVSMKVVSG